MKNLFFLFLFSFSFQLYAQSDSLFLDELRTSLSVRNYEEVINRTSDIAKLTEESKYLRAYAFYYMDKEDEALKLL